MSKHLEQFLQSCVVIDFETTSMDFHIAEILEFGISDYVDSWSNLSQLCKPSDNIDPLISSITNITDEMVVNELPFEKHLSLFTELAEMVEGNLGYFVAHNAFYDQKVLERYKNYGIPWLCTLRIAKHLYGNDPTVVNLKLPYLRYRFKLDIDFSGEAHRAGFDAYVTGKLLEFLIKEMISRKILDDTKPLRPQIFDWANGPIITDVMPFGKHKGEKLVNVPLSYWKWALENMKQLDEKADEYDCDFAASVEEALSKL